MDATYFTGQVAKSNRHEILVPWEPEKRDVLKWCWKCREWRVFSMFQKNKNRPDGYQSECVLCNSARKKLYRISCMK